MDVKLLVHLETVEVADGAGLGEFVWWGESPDFPELTAAAPHLHEMLERAKAALEDLTGEDVHFETELVAEQPAEPAADSQPAEDLGWPPSSGVPTKQAIRTTAAA
jgi:predicted RNase H-like HicB family nuclease